MKRRQPKARRYMGYWYRRQADAAKEWAEKCGQQLARYYGAQLDAASRQAQALTAAVQAPAPPSIN